MANFLNQLAILLYQDGLFMLKKPVELYFKVQKDDIQLDHANTVQFKKALSLFGYNIIFWICIRVQVPIFFLKRDFHTSLDDFKRY